MTLFEKIIARQIPANIVYEDEFTIAFADINPQAPVHILVCPKHPLAQLSHAAEDETLLLGRVMQSAKIVAKNAGLVDYRVVINNGAGAGQSVFHLHLHVLGGRPLSWPPG
jgi:histidine triad (HIT) family protein